MLEMIVMYKIGIITLIVCALIGAANDKDNIHTPKMYG